MSKRSFRDRKASTASYPTLRGFLARHRLSLTGLGLCLLTAGALPGCVETSMGVMRKPESLADARVERTLDGGSDALIADAEPAPDLEADLRKQRPDRERSR